MWRFPKVIRARLCITVNSSTEKATFEPPEGILRRFCVDDGEAGWYDDIIQEDKTILERMMYMMDWLKWKMIELLIEYRVLAVVPVREGNGQRRHR